MTALVVYESMFGNTRSVAEAVARGLAATLTVEVMEIGSMRDLSPDLSLLVVGGPTHAFGMSRPRTRQDARSKSPDGHVESEGVGLREALAGLPHLRQPLPAAVFDTKVRKPLTGSAGKGAGKALEAAGFRLLVDPEDFGVVGMSGPLEEGELERAEAWGAHLAALVARTPAP